MVVAARPSFAMWSRNARLAGKCLSRLYRRSMTKMGVSITVKPGVATTGSLPPKFDGEVSWFEGLFRYLPMLHYRSGAEISDADRFPQETKAHKVFPFGDEHFFSSSNPAQHLSRAVLEFLGTDRLHKWLLRIYSSSLLLIHQVKDFRQALETNFNGLSHGVAQ